MALQPVDIYVTDTTLSAAPIEGVAVHVYNAAGSSLITTDVTDAAGVASFLLDDGAPAASANYSVRFFKNQVSFTNPQIVTVLPAPSINRFDVKGVLYSPPIVADSRLCVAYGYFRTSSGRPAKHVDLHFIPKFNPIILVGSAVMTEREVVRTNEKGYVEIPLIRFGQYDVLVQGIEDLTRMISVPDQPNVNLPDLLFPVVSRVVFSPTGPFTVATNATLTVIPSITATDGNPLTGTAASDVFWDTDNHSIAVVSVSATTLTIRGLAAGTCNLIAKRVDQSIVRIPDTPITGGQTQITVT